MRNTAFGIIAALCAIIAPAAGDDGKKETSTVTTITQVIYIHGDLPSETGSISSVNIGKNTEWLTEEGGSTKWIGVNTEYLSAETQTITTNGKTSTIDHAVGISLGPTTTATNNVITVPVVISPGLQKEITELAAELCHGAGKHRVKRVTINACSVSFRPRLSALLQAWATVEANKDTAEQLAAVVTTILGIIVVGESVSNLIDVPLLGGKDQLTTEKTSIEVTVPAPTVTGSNEETTTSDGPKECWTYTGVKVFPSPVDRVTPGSKKRDEVIDATADGDADDDAEYVNLIDNESRQGSARSPKNVLSIGNCAQQLNEVIKGAYSYPAANVVMRSISYPGEGLPKESWWFVPQEQNPDQDGPLDDCPVAYLGQKGPLDIGMKNSNGKVDASKKNYPAPYTNKDGLLTVDHIFELSTLNDIFKRILKTPDDPKCQPFINLFMQDDSKSQGPVSRFQSLWYRNPSKQVGALAGIDEKLNWMKGKVFEKKDGNNALLDLRANFNSDGAIDYNLQLWNQLGLTVAFMKREDIVQQYNDIHNSMYRAFLAFDDIEKNCNQDGNDWAKNYDGEMSTWLVEREIAIAQVVDYIKQGLQSKYGAEGATADKYNVAYQQLSRDYDTPFFVLPIDKMLKITEETKADIEKRSRSRRNASRLQARGTDGCPSGSGGNAFSGPKTECNADDGDYLKINPDKAKEAIKEVCEQWHDDGNKVPQKARVGSSSNLGGYSDNKGVVEGDKRLDLIVIWDALGCPDGKLEDVDFGSISPDDCTANFAKGLDDCEPKDKPEGSDFWKIGGKAYGNCLSWAVEGNKNF